MLVKTYCTCSMWREGHVSIAFVSWLSFTVNPLYTDTRYNYKIHYSDNLTSKETPSQKVTTNQKLCRNIIIQHVKQHVLDIC